MSAGDPSDDQEPWLIACPGWDFNEVWIIPNGQRFMEVNPALLLVADALPRIELDLHGIVFIPIPDAASILFEAARGEATPRDFISGVVRPAQFTV